jgi:2-polyprenyl-3-methyl-5-hydroxy-6-metoxy-1,4-benzoquinol methylase
VSTRATCRICNGELALTHRGDDSPHDARAFDPTRHNAGEHHDLYRCRACGTVNQSSLPAEAELHALYRAVSDGRYMREEQGRRRTARRLLDLLATVAPRGRLLQVGSGHGLLLDEARRRGYDVEGVELWSEGVAHARDRLGLQVREAAIEDVHLDGERYDAVLLVDVLEHLADPIAVLDRMRGALAPGGALLVVTPDPSSLVARIAGRRWWCYVPAHVHLIPRATLRELIRARGLVTVKEHYSVHSFSLGYWLAGLGGVGGPLGAVIARLAERLPRSLTFTASLKDERVLLARDTGSGAPARS